MCVDALNGELIGYVNPDSPIEHTFFTLIKMPYTFDFAHSLIFPHYARQIHIPGKYYSPFCCWTSWAAYADWFIWKMKLKQLVHLVYGI